MKIGVFSICSKNYLSIVRVLMESAREHVPEYRRYLCLADKIQGGFDPNQENFQVVESQALGIPDHDDFSFRYDIMEYNTAVKPFMFRWLFESTDLDVVIYLDPDIQIFSKFDALEGMLGEGASMVFAPHVTEPIPDDGKKPTDLDIQVAGVFNLGFLAVRRRPESLAFINWWAEKLRRSCVSDPPRGIFVDQKWCNFAPCFISQCGVLRDPAYNVAYWNLHYRKIERENGKWLVNGRPLVFFHYSGINIGDLSRLSKHETRFGSPRNVPNLPQLLEQYAAKVEEAGYSETRTWKYAYGALDDGTPIHPLFRTVYREAKDRRAPAYAGVVGSPRTRQVIENLCMRPTAKLANSRNPLITDLMYCIWRQRPDVQSVFPLNTREERQGFARWYAVSARMQYGLPNWVVPRGAAEPPDGPSLPIVAWLFHMARKSKWLIPPFIRPWAKQWGKRLYWRNFRSSGDR